MTTDNRVLWKSTIVVALIASVTYLYYASCFLGNWAIGEFPVSLWCVWLGILLSTKIHVPVWLITIILCSYIGLYFFYPHFYVHIIESFYVLSRLGSLKYVVLLLFGLGISPELKPNGKFLENLVLFIVFLSQYIFMMLVAQRSWYVWHDLGMEPMEILYSTAKYGKFISLAAAIVFCIRMSLSDKMQTVLSRKGISITALALIFVVSTFNLFRLASAFGQIPLSVVLINPAISIMIILCIEKFVKGIQSKSQSNLLAILLFAAVLLQGSSATVSAHNANYSDIYALVDDFMQKPVTKSKCKEYSICAEELKLSATNRIDCEYAIRFKDFVDFLSGKNPNARFTGGEFSQLEDMLNLSITTLYEDKIISVLEFEVNGISVRVLHNKTQAKWISVSITSHRDSPFSSDISGVGAMEGMYVLYDNTLERKPFLPITDVKIISATDGLK